MNGIFLPNDPTGVYHTIPTPGFAISWAGENPLGEGFCFGSENGELLLTDTLGNQVAALGVATDSKEAVNGMAFSQNWIAVTTRADVNLIGPWLHGGREQRGVVLYESALDVAVAPRSGYFVIALGPAGLLFVKPGITEQDPVLISRSDKASLNFSRILTLPGPAGNDLIVCAGRREGLGITDFQEGMRGHSLKSVKFPALDLVDLCSLGGRAVAAVAKDGTLVLFTDILTDRAPQTVKLKNVQGTVYRLLSAGGQFFLLTSKGLYALFGLGEPFMNSQVCRLSNVEILHLPIKASDANLVRGKWLLAVGLAEVYRFDLEKMPTSSEAHYEHEEPEQIGTQPLWEESNMEPRTGAALVG